jgi:uncharacterized protein involved in response to NO
MKATHPVLLSYAFRPFFLISGVFSGLAVCAWVLSLHGKGLPATTLLWHSHEMLIGFAMAVVAGFSLTAVANWTGRPALHGAPIAWLVASWLAGRSAMLLSGWLPASLVFILDMAFPILLGILLGREIIGGRSKRNYPLVVIITMVIVLNISYHLGINQWLPGADRLAIYLLIHTLLLLVTIIAGRIVPNFTANWLRKQGQERLPIDGDLTNRSALSLTILAQPLEGICDNIQSAVVCHACCICVDTLRLFPYGLFCIWLGFYLNCSTARTYNGRHWQYYPGGHYTGRSRPYRQASSSCTGNCGGLLDFHVGCLG